MNGDDGFVWLLITTAVALVAGGISGWASAAYQRREKRRERIRVEVLRWANPILGAISSLESRLANILDDQLSNALDPDLADQERPADPDWAIGYDYAMESTLYLFAEYFAWIRLLQTGLSLELFESEEEKDRFDKAVWAVTDALADWPHERVDGDGADAQVFTLQQRAIGELLIRREGDVPRVLGYPEFLAERANDPRFEPVLAPLTALVRGVTLGSKRWQRLDLARDALGALRLQCDELLGLERTS